MTGPQTHHYAFPTAILSIILCTAGHAQIPAPPNSPGCSVQKEITTCNWQAFRQLLDSSHFIAIEHANTDRNTGKQLADLVIHLGKTIGSPDHPGDLTFLIVPTGEHGVDIGPADQPILDLQIYSGPTSSGQLLWVESLRGDPERPWPSSVHAVIDQFQSHLPKHP